MAALSNVPLSITLWYPSADSSATDQRSGAAYDLTRQETLGAYDINGNHVDPVLYFTYDEAGNRTSASDGITDGSGNAVNLTRYRYDTQGRVVASMTPLAGTNYASIYKTTYSYDAEGHETGTTDGDGNSQAWSYDYYGRELAHTDLGGHSVSDQYDAWGRLSHRAGSGQDVTYAYYSNGWLKSEQENFSGADSRLTLYRYDAAGNHILERYSDLATGQSWQDTRITYDALGRISQVRDDRYDIAYAYDAVGNREHTAVQDVADPTQPANTGTVSQLDYWYQYDAMNRLTLSQGSLSGGQIVIGSTGTAIAYDLGGDRRMTTSAHNYVNYDYDTVGRLVAARLDTTPNGGAPDTLYTYDQAGRQTSAESYANQGLQPETGSIAKSFYNANGWLITESDYTDDGLGHLSLQTRIRYSSSTASDSDTPSIASDAGYYDGAGNAIEYTLHNTPQNYDNTYQLYYARYGSYEQLNEIATTNYAPPSGSYVPGDSNETFDVYGHITEVQLNYGSAPTRDYVVDASGHILQQTLSNADGSQNAQQGYYYVHGAAVGNAGNLASGMADATATDAAVNRGETPNTPLGQALLSDATFAAGASDPTQQTSAGPGQYVIQAGDTLQSIATAVWGDASLWYLIADANGLTGNADLVTGQSLTIPNQIGSLHNNANTSAPYDAQKILGDIGAQPNYVPPPKPQCSQGSAIVGAIVGIIVTIVAILLTMPSGGSIWSLPASYWEAYGAGVAAAGAVAGSIAQQDTYLAANDQLSTGKLVSGLALTGDPLASSKYASNGKFSIGDVVIAAAAGYVTGGVASAVSGPAAGVLGSAAGAVATGVIAGATGAATEQLGEIILGHQQSFDWGSVAAGAVGGGISAGIGYGIAQSGLNPKGFGYGLAKGLDYLASGVASSEVQVLADGYGHINYAAIAVDAFHNALVDVAMGQRQVTPGEKQAASAPQQMPPAVAATSDAAPATVPIDYQGLGWDGVSSGSGGNLKYVAAGGGGPQYVPNSDDPTKGFYYQGGRTVDSEGNPIIVVPDDSQPTAPPGGNASPYNQDSAAPSGGGGAANPLALGAIGSPLLRRAAPRLPSLFLPEVAIPALAGLAIYGIVRTFPHEEVGPWGSSGGGSSSPSAGGEGAPSGSAADTTGSAEYGRANSSSAAEIDAVARAAGLSADEISNRKADIPAQLVTGDGKWIPEIQTHIDEMNAAIANGDRIGADSAKKEIQLAATTAIKADALQTKRGPVIYVELPNQTRLDRVMYLGFTILSNAAVLTDQTGPKVAAYDRIASREANDAIASQMPWLYPPELVAGANSLWVVGHAPDAVWTLQPEPVFHLPLTRAINSSIGAQNGAYPIGYTPLMFATIDVSTQPFTKYVH